MPVSPPLPFYLAINVVVMTILTVVAWSDWRERRIPNSTLALLLACTLFQFSAMHMDLLQGPTLRDIALNLMLAALLFVPGYATGQLGAGDVKLFSVLALLWPSQVYLQAFSVGILGLIVACFALEWLQRLGSRMTPQWAPAGPPLTQTLRERGIPAGTAIALGALYALA